MQPEDLLIRYSARTDIDAAAEDGLGRVRQVKIKKILSPDLDWAYFFKRAQGQRLSPLAYKAFLKINGIQDIIPSDIWQGLRDAYYSTLGSNILGLAQLEEIIAGFQKQDIAVVIFKGLMLAELVYGDMGLRYSGDLDILIKKEDILKADKVLRGLNYYPAFNLGDFEEIYFSNYRNSFFYYHRGHKQNPLHLYWRIFDRLPYHKDTSSSIDRVWQQAEPIKLGNISLRTFSLCHQIIYLSLHALSHCFCPLILLCDINELFRIKKDKLNWNSLFEEASKFGLLKPLYYTLYLAAQILETDIPQGLLSKIRPKKTSLFERRFIASILEGKFIFSEEWFMYLAMTESLRDRILLLGKALFPSRNELALIKQKDAKEINIWDYLRRVNSGLKRSAKTLLGWLKLVVAEAAVNLGFFNAVFKTGKSQRKKQQG